MPLDVDQELWALVEEQRTEGSAAQGKSQGQGQETPGVERDQAYVVAEVQVQYEVGYDWNNNGNM